MAYHRLADLANEEEVLKELNTGTLDMRIEKTIRFAARAMAFAAGGMVAGQIAPDVQGRVQRGVLVEAKEISRRVEEA